MKVSIHYDEKLNIAYGNLLTNCLEDLCVSIAKGCKKSRTLFSVMQSPGLLVMEIKGAEIKNIKSYVEAFHVAMVKYHTKPNFLVSYVAGPDRDIEFQTPLPAKRKKSPLKNNPLYDPKYAGTFYIEKDENGNNILKSKLLDGDATE